jgi:hypothetical protein
MFDRFGSRSLSATLVATLAVLALSGMAVAASVGHSSPASAVDANTTTDSTVPPGAAFASAVGAQQAELDGEVAARAFGVAVASATANASKARVVAREGTALQAQLQDLQTQRAQLVAAHQNGSVSEATYRARITTLTAKIGTLQHRANQTATVAERLPEDARAAHGVDAEAIRGIGRQAADLSGPEVAAIARSMAGPDVGKLVGPPSDVPGANVTERRGPPETPPGTGDGTAGPARGTDTASNATTETTTQRPGGDGVRDRTPQSGANATRGGGSQSAGSSSSADVT